MSSWRYRYVGLLFESAIEIPEWQAFARYVNTDKPDVRIDLDRSGVTLGAERPVIDAHRCTFEVRNVARFSIRDGDRIVVVPAQVVDSARVRVFLLGSALAAVCAQRNLLLLHASVVRIGDRVVALCGPQGSGKSTLAAALIDRGAHFVCDDLTRFEATEGRSTVYPSTPRLKLAPEALAALHWPSTALGRVYQGARKFHVPQAHEDPGARLPLQAIYVLRWTEGPVQMTPLMGLSSVREVVEAATYRRGFLEPMGRLAAHWHQCAAVVAGAPVASLARSQTWPALIGAAEAIERA